jgi:predicted transcriptional regulator
MAKKAKTRIVNLYITPGAFASIFKRLKGDKSNYDFSALAELRLLLSNEKAKTLNAIKDRKPGSIYQLAKILGRDFKAVSQDVKLLEKFGFIELIEEKKGKTRKLKPVLAIDNLQINIGFS